jgi:response regulator of citrate/malate metabolism
MIEKDMDLNEMNFNLIKNSNAFKPILNSKTEKQFDEIIDLSNTNGSIS